MCKKCMPTMNVSTLCCTCRPPAGSTRTARRRRSRTRMSRCIRPLQKYTMLVAISSNKLLFFRIEDLPQLGMSVCYHVYLCVIKSNRVFQLIDLLILRSLIDCINLVSLFIVILEEMLLIKLLCYHRENSRDAQLEKSPNLYAMKFDGLLENNNKTVN